MTKKWIIPVIFFFLLFFSQASWAKGTSASNHNMLSNTAYIFANNYYMTNISSTNIYVAEIHGIFEIVSTNTNKIVSPGQSHIFWYSISNWANISETNLQLILFNYQTNSGKRTGDWMVSLLEITNNRTNVIYSNNSYALPSFVTNKPSVHIPPDSVYFYGIKLQADSSADDNAWASINLQLHVMTNVSHYTSEAGSMYGWYGGATNVVNHAKAVVLTGIPFVTLSKSITLITNTVYGGNSPMPGSDIYYLIKFTNFSGVPGRNITIYDILPSKHIVSLSNGFTFNGFATNIAKSFSRDNGGLWNYSPATWDTNIDQIRFSTTNMNVFGSGGVGTIQYKVRIR